MCEEKTFVILKGKVVLVKHESSFTLAHSQSGNHGCTSNEEMLQFETDRRIGDGNKIETRLREGAELQRRFEIRPMTSSNMQYFMFEIEGVSRVCTHQLVRHRIASYDQESQRFSAVEREDFIIPHSIQSNPEALEVYQNLSEESRLKLSRNSRNLKSRKKTQGLSFHNP